LLLRERRVAFAFLVDQFEGGRADGLFAGGFARPLLAGLELLQALTQVAVVFLQRVEALFLVSANTSNAPAIVSTACLTSTKLMCLPRNVALM
jgi:hypothetical protein